MRARQLSDFAAAIAVGLCAACATSDSPGFDRSQRSAVAAEWSGLPGAETREALRWETMLDLPEAPQGEAPPVKPAPAPAGQDNATSDPDLAVAMVSGEPIDVRPFLVRTWLRSSDASREILDRLVVERLALLEAERQEIAVSTTRVDDRVEEAWRALGDGLERQGRGTSIADHLKRELGVDTEYYRRQLRREAIAQLVAERVVRVWSSQRERCRVRVVELVDAAALDAFSAGLAAGRDFVSLAKEFHAYRDKEPEGATILLIQNERAELSRLAFATPLGQVAGPLDSDQGRKLMFKVEQRIPAITGEWAKIAPQIEKSLTETPVDDLEFVQWRAEIVKSYTIDLEPFFRLIGVRR